MCTHSSLVKMPLAIGPLTNSRSFMSRYRTLKQMSSVRTILLLTGTGSTPCRLHSAAAHLSNAEKRIDSLGRFRVSRLANSRISCALSSSKRSWRNIAAGFESITDKHLSSRRVHTAAATRTEIYQWVLMIKVWKAKISDRVQYSKQFRIF